MKYNILPYPQAIEERTGKLDIHGITVATASGMDPRVVREAVALRGALRALTGDFHIYKQFLGSAAEGMIAISLDEALGAEAYTLDINEGGVAIIGGDAAGCFYGLKTLGQLIDQFGAELPCLYINDKPGMSYRGFYHDATRGRVPNLTSMKELVDTIARFKGNSLQLYVEHVFDFEEFKEQGRGEDQFLTPEELLELDEYCYDRFVDFVPSLSCFGHLYELLMTERFRHLCELEGYEMNGLLWEQRQAHHTIDPSNPESFQVVCSLIDQYLPLFRSRYFNICCDETFDLGKGRNEGKDTAELYVNFVNKISAHVRDSGKIPMMWGDILLHHPDRIEQVHKDNVLLNWNYNPWCGPEQIEQIAQTGYSQIVCPGNVSWMTFQEDACSGSLNITRMAKHGYDNGAMGILNTNWGDFGHLAPWKSCLYGTVLGICCGWNEAHTEITDDYNMIVSKLVYGQDENVVSLVFELGNVCFTPSWRYVPFYALTGNAGDMHTDMGYIENTLAVTASIRERLAALKQNDIIDSIMLSCESTAMLSKVAGAILKGDAMPVDEYNVWFAKYSEAWLAGSKRSELYRIEDCFKALMNI